MNRLLWRQNMSKTSCPSWTCPVCGSGHLTLIKDSLISKEHIESVRQHGEEYWDPECIEYIFTAWAECSNTRCKQPFVISGSGGIEADYDDEGGTDWSEYYKPAYCTPMPNIINFPKKCPQDVKDKLKDAFCLFWINQNACAGQIRVALEYLMTSLGVPKRKKTNSGKFVELTLHGRIEKFAESNPLIGAQLMALKWLGNAGSHESSVSESDLLDAFEILEHALSELIEKRSEKVLELAKKLTKKHS